MEKSKNREIENSYNEVYLELNKDRDNNYMESNLFPIEKARVPVIQVINPSTLSENENLYRLNGVDVICGVSNGKMSDIHKDIYHCMKQHFSDETFEALRNKYGYPFKKLIEIKDNAVLQNILKDLQSELQ